MAALVEEERPVVGSKAAIEISSHLRKQLPPSDFLLEKNLCLKTPTEIYAYKQFIKDRDENICSVGNVDTVQSESVCIVLWTFTKWLKSMKFWRIRGFWYFNFDECNPVILIS